MKKTRRIIAGVAALTMAISMSISTAVFTASAEVGSTIISCDQEDTHTYKGYQIFVGNVQTLEGEKAILADADLELGEAVNADALYAALGLEYDFEKTPAKALEAFSALDAAGVVELIKGDDTHDGILLEDSGRDIDENGTPFQTGYVYVEEVGLDDDVTGDILKIAQGETLRVTPKAGKPKVEKKVKEDDRRVSLGNVMDTSLYEPKYNDCADYCIGEEVPFEVVGSMPASIANYRHYYYEFTDRLGKGFKTPTDFVVAVDGNTVPSSAYELTVTPETGETTDATTISIKFDDIKAAVPTINAASKVVVTYKAILDDDADTTINGNTNEVYLTYSNDTEYGGQGFDDDEDKEEKTDDTSKDGVAVFTYSTELYKVTAGTYDTIDEGAYFVLLDENNVPGTVNTQNHTVTWADAALQDIGTLDETSEYKFELTPGFMIKGLDSGTYKLVEVKAPDGYVKLTDPVTFTITADDLNSDGTWDWLNTYTDNADSAWNGSEPGIADANNINIHLSSGAFFDGVIENVKGINLPETGGIGTKIFYGVGGAAVLTSGVILVAKKRAKKED